MARLNLKSIYKMVFPTIYVRHSSQTLYQCLLAAIQMYESTEDSLWQFEASKVKDRLLSVQQKDGGFDIGYFFNFGFDHKKGQSTSPELLSVVALIRYWEVFRDDKVKRAIERGIDWIIFNSFPVNGDWAIPYGPYSSDEVVVYNGVSFAQAPLGMWSRYEQNVTKKQEILDIYRGMNRYLAKQLIETTEGCYMKYSESRSSLSKKAEAKVDYYHMAQQLEMHWYGHRYCPDENAQRIVEGFGKYLFYLHEKFSIIPYLNNDPGKGIHLWGYSSCINAFIAMWDMTKEDKYCVAAERISVWIINNSYRKEKNIFYPVVSEMGLPLVSEYYPRSDAWVVNSLTCLYNRKRNVESLKSIILSAYLKISENDYSGRENHAGTKFRSVVRNIGLSLLR